MHLTANPQAIIATWQYLWAHARHARLALT
jgi:hypothetical protein